MFRFRRRFTRLRNFVHSFAESLWTPQKLLGSMQLWAADDSSPWTRIVNGTVRLIDRSRTGTACQMQPGRSYLFNGTSDKIAIGDTSGNCLHVSIRVKFVVDDQEILTLQNSTATAVTVVGGTLTFGASLTPSNIYVDGVSKTAAEAGALLNDNGWHRLDFDLASVAANNVVVGTDSSAFGNFYLAELRLFSVALSAAEVTTISEMAIGSSVIGKTADLLGLYKCDEGGTYTTAIDSSGNGNDGAITAAAIATFQDESGVNYQYSFQNELGSTDDTGTSGAYLPRDESAPTLDTGGGTLGCVGPVPHDPILSSPALALDGVADRVQIPAVAANKPTAAISVVVRVRVDGSIVNFDGIIENYASPRGVMMDFGSGLAGKWRAVVGSAAVTTIATSTQAINDGEWHSIAVVYDGTDVRLYTDGVLTSTPVARTAAIEYGAHDWYLGGDGVSTNYAEISVAHALITSDALTATEVANLHNGTLRESSLDNVVMFLPVCESAGATIYDATDNSDGTATLSSPATSWLAQQNVADTLVKDGYRRAGSVNIPAALTGGLAADGNALTHGPGTLAPGQSLDLGGGESDSPYAQQLISSGLADLIYDQGDDDEADVLFASVETAGATTGGDNRIITVIPPPVGNQLAFIRDYTS